ncbi:MAG: TVP38/TMEM64 family protein [Lacipirellulaceae bacterium]
MKDERTVRQTKPRHLLRIATFAVILIALFVATRFLPIGKYLTDFLEYVRALEFLGYALFLVVYVAATVLMVPGLILTLGAGFVFGLLRGTILISLSSVLGAVLAFVVGRYFARGFVEQKAQDYPKFAAVDRAVEDAGFKMVLLTRLSPLFPFNALNYLFGVTNVKLRDYFLASWIGMFPGTIMYVYFGTLAKNLADLARGKYEGGTAEKLFLVAGLLVTIGVTFYVTKLARKAIRDRIDEN